jgi:hypothetical protein
MGGVLNALQLEDGRYGYRYYYYYHHHDDAEGGGRGRRASRGASRTAPDAEGSRPALEAHPGGKSRSQG